MARVELDDVTKVYDDAQGTEIAVEELDIDIKDGEFVVFLGPSGCGKSTTLRMIAGLETVTSGEILIDDRVVNDLAPKERDIALVFQNYALYPHKTVRENIAYPLRLRSDYSSEEITQKVEETAELMGISDLLDKKPSALSGGQQQRVATGRAIIREPSVFLFDEPLSNLDAKLRKHMRVELARLHSELDITTIHVTHNQEEAMTLAERIVVLKDAKLQQVGSPKEIYHHPANLFVADFIGSPSMNFFDMKIDAGGRDTLTLTNEAFEYEYPDSVIAEVEEQTSSSAVTLGIRPEDVRIVENPTEHSVGATIDIIETVGSDDYYYTSVGEQECVVRHPTDKVHESDQTVNLVFDPEKTHLFDSETGQAILNNGEVTAETPMSPPMN